MNHSNNVIEHIVKTKLINKCDVLIEIHNNYIEFEFVFKNKDDALDSLGKFHKLFKDISITVTGIHYSNWFDMETNSINEKWFIDIYIPLQAQ